MSQASYFQRLSQRYLHLVIKRPGLVLAIAAAVTLLCALQIPKLSFSTSVYDLIIQDLPENQRYRDFKALFGSDEIIRVVVKGPNVFEPAFFESLTALSDALAQVEGVRQVIGLPGVRRAVDIAGTWSMAKFAEMMGPVGLFERNLFSADRRTAALTVILRNDANQKAVIAAVQRVIDADRATHSIYQIGMPLVSKALETYTRKDFFRLPPITLCLIVIVLWFVFKRWDGMALPVVCVGTSLVWTFGVIAQIGIPLSILTMIVPVFIIAVGTAYCLHVMAEYQVWAGRSGSVAEAVEGTFRHTTFPSVLAVGTTAVGLASLFISRIPMIREFALFASIGMFSMLVVILGVLPALMRFGPRPRGRQEEGTRAFDRVLDRLLGVLVDWIVHRQKPILVLFGMASVFCLIGVLHLKVETNPMRYFKPELPISRHFHDIYRDLCGAFPIHVTLSGGRADFFEDPSRIAALAELQAHFETLPEVDKAISLADYLKMVKYAANGFDPVFYTLPAAGWDLRMTYNSFKTMLGEEMLHRFVTPDLAATQIVLMTHISSSSAVLDLRRKIEAHLEETLPQDVKWDVTGFSVVVAASSDLLTRGQIKSLALTMAVIFAIMYVLFLSVRVGLIAIVPNLFPIVVNFGVMGWLGIELSAFTSLIASIAIGLAVDDTIHYLVRYGREFKRDLNDERALDASLRHTGRPIVFTSLTISTGFAILTLSSFQPTAVFGLMMVVTMLSALAGDLLLLPVLMRHVELVTLWDLVRAKLGADPEEGLPIFRGLSHTEVHYIIAAGALRRMAAGEVIFKKGDTSDSMFVVIAGEIEVLDHSMDVDPIGGGWDVKRLAILNAGAMGGEWGWRRGAPRTATVVACQESELLQINMNMIRRLQWLYPPAAHRFFVNLMNLLCHRIEQVSQSLFEASRMDDLSGLYNRRTFLRVLEQELRRCRRYGFDLCLCLVYLKEDAENPSEGPGKTSLSPGQIAFLQDLPRMVRQSDTLGRIDHLTLGILMPNTPPEEARHLCGRLHEVFNTHQLRGAAHLVRLDDVPLLSGEALLLHVLSRIDSSVFESISTSSA